jgi:hypothetical protein
VWQTIALYGTVALVILGIAYMGRRMLVTQARKGAGDAEALETLERILEIDRKSHRMDGQPVPLGRTEQLERLRALLKRLPRRRNREAASDE